MAQNEPVKDTKKIIVDLTMTVEQARGVKWFGRHSDKVLGDLIDSKTLTNENLAWAAEKAYNTKHREAARTMLAHWLGLPATLEATQKYGPKVITGTNYLREEEEVRLGVMGFLFGIGFMLLFLFISWIIFTAIPIFQRVASPSQQLGAVIGVILVGLITLGTGWYWVRKFSQSQTEYRSFRAGREGEDKVTEQLRAVLDNRWTIFRNLVLPNRKEDVDLVLVGPAGVWAVQVKSSKSTLRAQGKEWEVQTKKGWITAAQNPYKEVSSHASKLNIYLQQQGVKRYVQRAIALATDQPISYFETSEIPVWIPPTLENELTTLSTAYPPDEQETRKIVEILERLNDLQTNAAKS